LFLFSIWLKRLKDGTKNIHFISLVIFNLGPHAVSHTYRYVPPHPLARSRKKHRYSRKELNLTHSRGSATTYSRSSTSSAPGAWRPLAPRLASHIKDDEVRVVALAPLGRSVGAPLPPHQTTLLSYSRPDRLCLLR
jgi:hypothetical protein